MRFIDFADKQRNRKSAINTKPCEIHFFSIMEEIHKEKT